MKPIIILIVLLCFFLSLSAQAQECKVDRLEITKIKTLKPASGITDESLFVINNLAQEALLWPAGYVLKPALGIAKIANQTRKAYYSKKLAYKAGETGYNKILDDSVDALIKGIDDDLSEQDDLIFRINGVRVVPNSLAQKYFPMTKDAVYPYAVSGSFLGTATVQIVEYDSGSMNDDLGSFEFFDENTIQNPRTPINSDTITLFSALHGDEDNDDESIYELDYTVVPRGGVLDEIPERLVCDLVECKDAREPITPYEYDYSNLLDGTPQDCPAGYDYAGFLNVYDPIFGLYAYSYNVCELIPHVPTPASPAACGATFFDVEGFYDINNLEDGTIITLKSNSLAWWHPSDNTYLSAQTGQYLARSGDSADHNTFAHVIDPNRSLAHWKIKKLDNGKFALRADNEKYLALCNGCVPGSAIADRAFVHVSNPDTYWAQFTIEQANTGNANDYTIGIVNPDNGLTYYLSVCLGCVPGQNRPGFGYSGTFHLTDKNSPFATWEISFRLPTTINAKTFSDLGDGVYNKDITIKPTETWYIQPGDVMTLKYGRTLTIESGGKLVNNGTLLNEGKIYIGELGSIDNSIFAKIINKEIIQIQGGTLNNEGVIDNTLANYLINNGTITSDIPGGGVNDRYGDIYDPYGKYFGNATTNSIINGHYLGPNFAGEMTCVWLGGVFDNANNSCTLTNFWLEEDKTLSIDRNLELIIIGTLDNYGTIINDGTITNTNGNINTCPPGTLDVDGVTGFGTISNPVQACFQTADQELCTNYGGIFSDNTCTGARGWVLQENPLIIRSGITWDLGENGSLANCGGINIEAGAELIVRTGISNHSETSCIDAGFSGSGVINNHGKLSVEYEGSSGLYGRILNETKINNLGVIDNYGDIIGEGEIQNICDGSLNAFPDWPTRLSPQAGYGYDPEGEFHNIYDYSCSPFDTDNDGAGDINDAFPYDVAASIDTDGDGYPDSWTPGKTESDSTTGLLIDAFPNDITQWEDSDGDGVGDNPEGNNPDAFPDDVAASIDTDDDGFPDSWNPGKTQSDSTTGLHIDAFPNDPLESKDSDFDNVGDNADAFPNNGGETKDSDYDNVGDNADAFPNDDQNLRLISVDSSNGWSLVNARFIPASGGEYQWDSSRPSGLMTPNGLVVFDLVDGNIGSDAVVTIKYPEPLDPTLVWWKYGSTASNNEPHWYIFDGAVINGDTVTLIISDGGTGDGDLTENGVIIEPIRQDTGGPGIEVSPCKGDFDEDGDVDGIDLSTFSADFGRIDCSAGPLCEGDFEEDGSVDDTDLNTFTADFGRIDCP